MASIQVSKNVKPTTINKFLGLNISDTGDTQLKLGESGNMTNFYITDDYKLRKMYGYKNFYDFKSTPQGVFSTKIGNNGYLLVAIDGKLYAFNQDELEDSENLERIEPMLIGNIGTSECSFFEFNNIVYILCGNYYKWDGNTLSEVEGYIPLIFINGNPTSGSGTIYDELNLLTDKKHMTFNGDGATTAYHLPQQNIGSVDKVLVNAVETSAYTVDLTTGVVTFTTVPDKAMDNVDIYWSKQEDNDKNIIKKMRFGTVYGGDIDSRVFLYGNPSCKNRIYFSGFEDGVPGAEYFPAANQVDVGPSNFAVTDLTRQYDKLLVTTNKPEAYFIESGTENLTILLDSSNTTTRLVPSITTHPLNEAHGNVAMGQGQLIRNYPVTIDRNCFTLWKATNLRDEKNAESISERINVDLDQISMNMIKTLDYQLDSQIWFCHNNKIWIYQYENDTYSRVSIPDNIAYITSLDDFIYTLFDDGTIAQWSKSYKTFNGEIINAQWEMDFSDFGAAYLRKTMRKMWVLMQPQGSSSADISYITNLVDEPITKHIGYQIQTLDDVDFSNFSFEIQTNPQPFRLKLKAKKFTNMKITIKNTEETYCTILSLMMKVESFGESK